MIEQTQFRKKPLVAIHQIHDLKQGEEADETTLWLELIIESETLNNDFIKLLHKESNELTAIFTSSGKTAKENNSKK